MKRSRAMMGVAGMTSVRYLAALVPSSSMHSVLEAIDALKGRDRDRRSGCR